MLATLYHGIGLRSQIPLSSDLKGHGRRSPPYAFACSFIVEYFLSQKEAAPMTSLRPPKFDFDFFKSCLMSFYTASSIFSMSAIKASNKTCCCYNACHQRA